MAEHPDLPVVVIGAGPIGLAAAARLAERKMPFRVLEAGPGPGTAVQAWRHVRVFSPWSFNMDAAARALLEPTGWRAPDPDTLPTGAEFVARYLQPLAEHPVIAPHLEFEARVEGIAREGLDKLGTTDRGEKPFVLRWRDAAGQFRRTLARAVIDASGTWTSPNPIGIDGLPVPGEAEAADRIAYGIPDVLGAERAAYAGRRVLVVGGGHSAINLALDLLRLQETEPGTGVLWALRRNRIDRLLGGGINDQLPERGALGVRALAAIEAGRLEILAPFGVHLIESGPAALRVHAEHDNRAVSLTVDRIVVATGFRPELGILREIRVALDPTVEAPLALAPLIDPNLHSCGTVPPHGAAELAHPEPGFYIVGAKSYGRAPTFLMATGYEQVRSVVAEIAGDCAAAREVRLVLPETGICSAGTTAGCCGGPAPDEANACCKRDAEAKAAGAKGCGCRESRDAATPFEPAA